MLPTDDTLPENQGLSQEAFQQLLTQSKKFKERSHSTFQNVHLSELIRLSQKPSNIDTSTSLSSEDPDLLTDETPTTPVATVLIGDSMLERLKTTGISTGLAKLSGSFNVGCGGDKIENVLYRLDLMYPLLQNCRDIKLWIVMVGTNNLRKKGFRPADVALYRLLLQALLRIAPRSKVLACEMFRRKDIEDRYVDEANRMVKEMIKAMNDTLGDARIMWSEAPEDVTKEMFEDHVHLDELGYSRWDGHLLPRVQELLLDP
ncbi:SGNH hydrolase [Linnemannia elongata AG-77]|uniref:SGNH hydrolase n=1 Tax=Linnemannia elongata AG-77 TaxID=1314771 RepID=A0A197K3J4_9FUNG|nr:SGNH hydrolase [Linnemannia elongata AG-77]